MAKAANNKPDWRDAFKSSSLRCGFHLGLTRAMCEYVSAVADGVQWDRTVFGSCSVQPDNFMATARALAKRGLIQRKTQEEIDARRQERAQTSFELWSWNAYVLTPAGERVVDLLKMAGLFVEADIAIEKKARAGRSA